MSQTQIVLTETESELLRDLSRQTGKADDELVREALMLLKDRLSSDHQKRLAAFRQAKGMWQDREDLPLLEQLRGEMNRDFSG